ncbi:MAG: leucine-rich repeat domain-containing protein [Promethearchaeota archaeon]
MSKQLTPEIFAQKYKEGKLQTNEAETLLIDLIENSEDDNNRLNFLKVAKKFNIKGKKFYKFLENIILSDNNPEIRSIGIEILAKLYPIKSIEPFRWIIKYEKYISVLLKLLWEITKSEKNEKLYGILVNDFLEFFNPQKYEILNDPLLDIERLVIEILKKINAVKIKDGYIESIDLSGLNISELPDFFAKFSKLKRLIMYKSIFQEIPKSIESLTHLEEIILSSGNIRRIPEFFGELKNLRYLNLNNNKIQIIPKSFEKLSNLRYLELRGNDILIFP